MKTIFVGLIFLCLYSSAQETRDDIAEDREGIQWVKGLSWEQIKEKAQKENKYIFVDCYATWCGPCKRMDEEVYVKDTIGEYMNAKFVNVKVQMDKTKNDDEEVRKWYNDAAQLQARYKVVAFPSYLFFNPQGQIVHRDLAYIEPEKFLTMVAKAFDPKSQYYHLKAEYESGQKDYAIVRDLVGQAKRFGDDQFVKQLRSDYLSYLSKQRRSIIFNKGNIDFIASAIQNTKSPWLKMFYTDENKINKVMGQSGFATRVIDSAIAREFINPALSALQPGQEPDWNTMYINIKTNFYEKYAMRNIAWKKAWWYRLKKDSKKYRKYFVECLDIGAMDTSFFMTDIEMNFFAYEIVVKMKPNEREENNILNKAIQMMEGVVRRSDNIIPYSDDPKKDSALTVKWKCRKIDNFASLLYVAGRKKEAIEWEEQAVRIAESNSDSINLNEYKNILNAMKQNKF